MNFLIYMDSAIIFALLVSNVAQWRIIQLFYRRIDAQLWDVARIQTKNIKLIGHHRRDIARLERFWDSREACKSCGLHRFSCKHASENRRNPDQNYDCCSGEAEKTGTFGRSEPVR